MIKDHLIVFFPLVDWDAPWQRYQQFASAFANYNKVIYFEPGLSINYFLRRRDLLWRKLVRCSRIRRQIGKNLYVLHTPPILPCGNMSRLINRINQIFLLLLIKVFTGQFKEKTNLCLWISDAIHYPLIPWLKPKISVYDCTDAIIFGSRREQDFHDQMRRRIIEGSSVSFFTSQRYFNEGRKYSNNCHYVPNGVDLKHFRRRGYRIPKEMQNMGRPILGFVGTLDARIDQDIVREILIRKPGVSLVFVGPITDDLHKLKASDRVFLLGKKDYRSIPDFINQFDVALIPYRLYENTRHMYPVKLHEYLILGKPVVSTSLPEVRQFSEAVYIAEDKREFVEKIDQALEEKSTDVKERRIRIALANTWNHRLGKIERELGKVAKTRPQVR
jgi:glycosyltransferase involved in cell wall biosynthesis